MSNITYQLEPFLDVIEEMKPLLDKHWEEIALHKDKIKLNPDYELYTAMDSIGRLKMYTAREDGELVGYFVVIKNKNLHYSDHFFALNDIIYVKPDKRGASIAYQLIGFAETELRKEGVSVLMINMKTHSPFDHLLEKCGFSFSEKIYSKYIGE